MFYCPMHQQLHLWRLLPVTRHPSPIMRHLHCHPSTVIRRQSFVECPLSDRLSSQISHYLLSDRLSSQISHYPPQGHLSPDVPNLPSREQYKLAMAAPFKLLAASPPPQS